MYVSACVGMCRVIVFFGLPERVCQFDGVCRVLFDLFLLSLFASQAHLNALFRILCHVYGI